MVTPLKPARVLTPLGLAITLSLFGDLTLYAVLVTQLEAVGLTLASVGIMLAVNRLIRIPGNPIAGLLVDRFGRRRLFLLGMALGVISTAGYALVRGFWPFLATRLAWGIAWTLINVGGMAMVMDVSTTADRGRLAGIYHTWVLVGLGLSPLVGAYLVDSLGFDAGMLACAALTGAGLLIALVALPETAPRARRDSQRQERVGAATGRGLRGLLSKPFNALRHGGSGLITASVLHLIILFAGEGVVFSTISLLLQQRLGSQVVVMGAVLGVATLGGLMLGLRALLAGVAGPLAGHWSDTRAGRWPLVAASLVTGIAGFALLAFAQMQLGIAAGVALGAISAGAAQAILIAVVGDLAPAGRQGVVLGGYATMGDIGSALGPLVAFALVLVVDLKWVYLFCSLAFAVGLVLVWRQTRTA